MKLMVGLGNPGQKYAKNRHNVGFMVVDALVKNMGRPWEKNADLMCDYAHEGEIIVMKPTIFMNQSGEAVVAVAHFYKIETRDILVVHDDLDLDFGKIRLAFDSSSAGHKGVESVISALGSIDFARLRVGLGRSVNQQQDPADFVLEDFTGEEFELLGKVIAKCVEAINSFINEGIEATMNRFN